MLNLAPQSKNDLLTSPPLSPGRKLLQASDITPRDLAIALTLLEGDKYKAIVPCDYIAHLRRHSGFNSVEVACSVNNKIVLWVKQSVLHYDTAELRTQVLKFFLNTAQVSRFIGGWQTPLADRIYFSGMSETQKLRVAHCYWDCTSFVTYRTPEAHQSGLIPDHET